jgi:phosphoserine phosphatase
VPLFASLLAGYQPGLLRPEVMQRVARYQARGDRVVPVSDGPDTHLPPWRRQHGLELLCFRLGTSNDRLTGRHHGVQRAGEEKTRRVRTHPGLANYLPCHAYGDSHENEAMLALAHGRFYLGREVHHVATHPPG